MKSTVFVVFAIGLFCLIGKTDATVTYPSQPTTAIIDNNAVTGSAVVTVLGTAGTGTLQTHSITGVTNSGITYFTIDGASGAITLEAAGATAIGSAVASTEYVITVSVQDDDAAVTHDVTVSVNLPPAFTSNPYTFSVADASTAATAVDSITVTDPDGDAMTYILTGTGNTDFAIANKAITVATGVTLVRSTTASYTLKVEATDSRLTTTADVTINVNAASSNNDPVFSSTTYSFTTTDGAASGTDVGSVTITDADTDTWTFSITSGDSNTDFAITNTGNSKVGTIATAKVLDKATTSSYTLTVTLTDATVTVTTTVTITFSGASTLVPMLLMIMMCSMYNYV